MNKVLVIIVTYNGIKWMDRCLSSLRTSTVPVDIVLIDNKSIDNTVSYVRGSYPEVNVLPSESNLGFGAANNIGLKIAYEKGYDYIYLLNQDAWIFPDSLEKLIKASKNNPEYGILSPLQFNSPCKLDTNFTLHVTQDMISDYICGNSLEEVYPTDFVMAAHWLITKKALCSVGGFSPVYKHYGEDNNYIDRLKYMGYGVGIVPGSKAIHDRGTRETTKQTTMFYSYLESIRAISNPSKNIIRSCIVSPIKYFMSIIKHKYPKGLLKLITLYLSIPKLLHYRQKSKHFSFIK